MTTGRPHVLSLYASWDESITMTCTGCSWWADVGSVVTLTEVDAQKQAHDDTAHPVLILHEPQPNSARNDPEPPPTPSETKALAVERDTPT
jgi:hypothetical protein